MKELKFSPVVVDIDNRKGRNFSRIEAASNLVAATRTYLAGTQDHWLFIQTDYVYKYLGSKEFWKPIQKKMLSFSKGKFSGNIDYSTLNYIAEKFNIDWLKSYKDINLVLSIRKDLWSSVFRGKVTNVQDLLRLFNKKYFKGAYQVPTLKKFFSLWEARSFSLWHLYEYTTNPQEALRRLVDSCDEPKAIKGNAMDVLADLRDSIVDREEFRRLLDDTLRYAHMLNQKINPLWSIKRMQEEHQNQIYKVELSKIEKCSATPLAPVYKVGNLSLILSEKDCYKNSIVMHNCTYNCYWRRVTKGEYLIARGAIDGVEVNVGIYTDISPNHLLIDQIHGVRNTNVPATVDIYCTKWVSDNKEGLLKVMETIKQNYSNSRRREITEIPW